MNKILESVKDLKVAQKLKRCFIIIVLFASLSGVIATFVLLYTNYSYGHALQKNGFSQGEIGEFNTNLNKGAALIRDFILISDTDALQELRQNFDQTTEEVNNSLEIVKNRCTTADEIDILEQIDKLLPEYRNIRQEVIDMGLMNKNDAALIMLQDQALPVLDQISELADKLVAMNKEMGNDISSQLNIQSYIAVLVIVLIILGAAFISTRFAINVARMFSEPIISVKDATAQLAQGNLNIELHKVNEDEIGEMTDSFNEAIATLRQYVEELSSDLGELANGNFTISLEKTDFRGDFQALGEAMKKITNSLSDTLTQINDSSEQVALGSAQMAESAQSLAEGATDQAGAVEELTATIQDVTEAVVGNAETANNSYESAREFGRQAEASNQDIQELNHAMARINETSNQIANIISEIEDIASQTNLLSLNASIEAARAGEAGKGFAVVADQIGKLAADSATSAVNTRQLIENSIHEIQKGNEITAKTTEAIRSVIEGIKSLAESTKEISDLSMTQAESMKQLEQGVEQISEVIQNNSAAAEQTSATSQELSAQSDNLKNLVEQFQLRK